jgi:type II secretory pathway pseudopilin PulG
MKDRQRGQIIVFLLLLVVILVTILLSLSSRTLQEFKSSSSQERSARAFTAAEAAIEEALRQDLDALIGAGGSGEVNFDGVTATYTAERLDDYVVDLDRDDIAHVDLADWPGCGACTNPITVCWEEAGVGSDAALELTFYEQDAGGTVNLVRYAVNAGTDYGNGFVNPDDPEDRGLINKSSPSASCSGYDNEVEVTPALNEATDAIYLRLKAWYAPTKIRVLGVPPQVAQYTGEGVAADTEVRRVRAQVYPASWPPIFDYVLFDGSGNPLSK